MKKISFSIPYSYMCDWPLQSKVVGKLEWASHLCNPGGRSSVHYETNRHVDL